MDTGIPTPERFRQYANTIGLFLREMHDKYPTYLPFASEQDRENTFNWIEFSRPVYQRDLTSLDKRLVSDFKDVSEYWERDHAYNTARQRVSAYHGNEPPSDRLPWLIEKIVSLTVKYKRHHLKFEIIRRFAEAELRWKQGLSLAVANYLDGTSYQITLEAKASANRISELITELESELQKPGACFLLDMPDWPVMGRMTRKDLGRFKNFLQTKELQASLNFRKDSHLINRTTALDILAANHWAFKSERKELAFILLGLSAFDSPIDLEPKTLERIWAKRKQQQSAVISANLEARLITRDRKGTRKSPFSDPQIPNFTRSVFGD